MAQPVMNPEDWVQITYLGPTHQHVVMGRSGMEYGYYGGGDKFKVLKVDQAAQPEWFTIAPEAAPTPQTLAAQIEAHKQELAALVAAQSQLSLTQTAQPQTVVPAQQPPAPAPEPEPEAAQPDNFTALEGIGEAGQLRLVEAGVTTFTMLAMLDPTRLTQILGPPMTAEKAVGLIAEAGTQ